MALDGGFGHNASNEENTFGIDGVGSVPVSRLKVFPKTHVSITISLSAGHHLLGFQFPVSVKPVYGQFQSERKRQKIIVFTRMHKTQLQCIPVYFNRSTSVLAVTSYCMALIYKVYNSRITAKLYFA